MILLYPGSFDPVTLGHVDIARRGAKLASRLVVAVVENPNKKTLFTLEERLALLREEFCGCENIEVDAFSGLLAEYAGAKGADAILRGLRTPGDFESEGRYAVYNRMLGNVETIFLPASPELSYISSSIVREASAYTDDSAFDKMVSPAVRAALKEKMNFRLVKG